MSNKTRPSTEPLKTEITVHVFHYPTHSVTWTIHYGPVQEDMMEGVEVPSTVTGMNLMVWCDYHLTQASAEKYAYAHNRHFARYFDTYVIEHKTVCPFTGERDCRSRHCELHYMDAPLRLEDDVKAVTMAIDRAREYMTNDTDHPSYFAVPNRTVLNLIAAAERLAACK